jgi:hypothetical protein
MTKKDFQNWNPIEMGAIDTLLQNEREECLRIAQRELTNCFLLNTSPPQSAAAFSIINKIKDRMKK